MSANSKAGQYGKGQEKVKTVHDRAGRKQEAEAVSLNFVLYCFKATTSQLFRATLSQGGSSVFSKTMLIQSVADSVTVNS